MQFIVLKRHEPRKHTSSNVAVLQMDDWNDYSFVTQFKLTVYDCQSKSHELGDVKIGFTGQTTETKTFDKIEKSFNQLEKNFFSLGDSLNFYKIASTLGDLGKKVLTGLNDLVLMPELIKSIREEEVFSVSLLRSTSLSIINGQYSRILNGGKELTEFKFSYIREGSASRKEIELEFDVLVESKPSTNIHAIIGRNGVGKTTLLNDMIYAVTKPSSAMGKFIDRSNCSRRGRLRIRKKSYAKECSIQQQRGFVRSFRGRRHGCDNSRNSAISVVRYESGFRE